MRLGIFQRLRWGGRESDVAKFIGKNGVWFPQRDFQDCIIIKPGKLGIFVAIGILQIVVAFNVFENGCPDLAAGGATWTTGWSLCRRTRYENTHDPHANHDGLCGGRASEATA